MVCREHPSDGHFCGKHRREHIRTVAKRNAELDSRPRERANERPVQNLAYLLRAASAGVRMEAARLV
jgi:hypothetical protein